MQATRRARKLPELHVDQTLTAAASAGGQAIAAGTAKNANQAIGVAGRALAAAGNRRRAVGVACQTYLEIIDRHQLTQIPVLRKAEIRAIGVATAEVESDVGKKLAVIVISDAGAGKTLRSCE